MRKFTFTTLLNDPEYEKQQAYCAFKRGSKDLPQLLQTFIQHFAFIQICSFCFHYWFITGSRYNKKKEILNAGKLFTNLCIILNVPQESGTFFILSRKEEVFVCS